MGAVLLAAILQSAFYALLALGLSLLFGVGGVLNLAHGALLMIAAYLAYTGLELVGLPVPAAFALGVGATALLAALLYRGLIARIQHSTVLTLLVTLAITLIAQQAIAIGFGASARTLPPLVPGHIDLGGITVPAMQLVGFGVAWVAVGLFGLGVERTRFGKAVRATAMDPKGAALVGISPRAVYTRVWALAGGLAGLAGVFLAYPGGIGPRMWIDPLVIAFAVVVLGGLGSLRGSLIAAHIVGFVEVATFYAPPLGAAWVGVPSLVLTVLVLVLRPQGLFGRPAV